MNNINEFINNWDFTKSQSHWNNNNTHNYFVEVYNNKVINLSDEDLESLFNGYAIDTEGRKVKQFMGSYVSDWVDAWFVAGVLHSKGILFNGMTNQRFQNEMFYLDILLNYELG